MITDESILETTINMRNRTMKLERESDYWTEQEKDQLSKMFNSGIGITEMAIRLQRTEPAVMQQIDKLDLYQRKLYPQRKTKRKFPSCLCNTCQLDKSSCPRCDSYNAIQEDE